MSELNIKTDANVAQSAQSGIKYIILAKILAIGGLIVGAGAAIIYGLKYLKGKKLLNLGLDPVKSPFSFESLGKVTPLTLPRGTMTDNELLGRSTTVGTSVKNSWGNLTTPNYMKYQKHKIPKMTYKPQKYNLKSIKPKKIKFKGVKF